MIGVLFATEQEAAPFLHLSRAIQVDRTPFALYQLPDYPRLLAAISGIGKVSAAVVCQALIREYGVQEVINAGVCGALRPGDNFEPGRLLCITTAVEGDHEARGSRPEPLISDGHMDWDLPAARLVTSDRSVFNSDQRSELSAIADLVDMEGAAIARVAAMYSTPWTMIKGVTDTAGTGDRATLEQNLALVSEAIGRCVWNQVKRKQ